MDCRDIIMNTYMINERYGIIHEEEISSLAENASVTAATAKKHLKILNCEIYKRKPPLIKDLETYVPVLEQLKLKSERRMSRYVQNRSVREQVGQGLWNKVRTFVLQENNHCCSICGYTTEDLSKLHVHEEWEVDDKKLILHLTSLSLLCMLCHNTQHLENTFMRIHKLHNFEEIKQQLEIHFMKVNECSQEILVASRRLASKQNIKDKLPPLHSPESLQQYFEKKKKLEKADWLYNVFEAMPLYEEVTRKLRLDDRTVNY
jgi:5-methylcytosine-specific restriction endonuclease McrA